jgi:hypothetical protein
MLGTPLPLSPSEIAEAVKNLHLPQFISRNKNFLRKNNVIRIGLHIDDVQTFDVFCIFFILIDIDKNYRDHKFLSKLEKRLMKYTKKVLLVSTLSDFMEHETIDIEKDVRWYMIPKEQ